MQHFILSFSVWILLLFGSFRTTGSTFDGSIPDGNSTGNGASSSSLVMKLFCNTSASPLTTLTGAAFFPIVFLSGSTCCVY